MRTASNTRVIITAYVGEQHARHDDLCDPAVAEAVELPDAVDSPRSN
jgi:hypothetical protein